MAARRLVTPNSYGIWVKKDVAVLPVLACMGVAAGWCGYMSSRHLFTSPDVAILPSVRAQPLKDHVAERGTAWWNSHQKYVAKDHSKIRIFGSFETKA